MDKIYLTILVILDIITSSPKECREKKTNFNPFQTRKWQQLVLLAWQLKGKLKF